jgi:hypothetical protein
MTMGAKQDLVFLVTGTVRLNARAEVVRRSDRDAAPGKRVEDRPRDRRQLVVVHALGDCGDDLARQRVAMRASPGGRARREQRGFQAADREAIEIGVMRMVAGTCQRSGDAVVHEHGPAHVGHPCGQQQVPRLAAQAVVGRAANEQIALLEGVGDDECLAQFLGVHGPRAVSSNSGSGGGRSILRRSRLTMRSSGRGRTGGGLGLMAR